MTTISWASCKGLQGSLEQLTCRRTDSGVQVCVSNVCSSEQSIREATVRVRSAVKQWNGLHPEYQVQSRDPFSLQHRLVHSDLAAAIGVLCCSGTLPDNATDHCVFIGELALTGEVRAVSGLCVMLEAVQACPTVGKIFVPQANAAEAASVLCQPVYGVERLSDLVSWLSTGQFPEPIAPSDEPLQPKMPYDMKDVCGHEAAKRALTIAAAGNHNVMLIGPLGVGKTMLARRALTILPQLTAVESAVVTQIMSVSGLLQRSQGRETQRMFRAPHHTVSTAGMLGGGTFPRPGEVTLSHKGVLFLDDYGEFPRVTLDAMWSVLDAGSVRHQEVFFPARPELVIGSATPCACGSLGSGNRQCTCHPASVVKHQTRSFSHAVGGAFFDMQVVLPQIDLSQTFPAPTCSLDMQAQVEVARTAQYERFGTVHGNSRMPVEAAIAKLSPSSAKALHAALLLHDDSIRARVAHKIIRVARTIADLENCVPIHKEHIVEAAALQNGWTQPQA